MSVELPMQVVWGVIGYILVTTGMGIWWAATTTQQLRTLKGLVDKLTDMGGLYARREDIQRELAVIERNQETMWSKFDKLKERVDGHVGQKKESV